ncbi:hypothetical protein [Dactylosporangium sp. NPDC051541]|uniref:hypothetical protein n=1 Tax=Dactylosporangium sp. NPDC051541 TaxID=3363977 RepID=UPI0037AC9D8C
MRRSWVLIATVLMLLTACGDPVEQSGATQWQIPAAPPPGEHWTGKITIDRSSGAIAAPGFNDLIDRASPPWSDAPDTTAAELLALNGPFDGRPKIYLSQERDGAKTIVTATVTNLGDDSISAERYRVELTPGPGGHYRFTSGRQTRKCRSGRGHQDFTTEFCS